MKWKPIRRAQGDYEKMMKFMKFHQSDDHYEVHDPDLLRMKKQNESLKSALNEANQSVKQIQTLFETQTVKCFPFDSHCVPDLVVAVKGIVFNRHAWSTFDFVRVFESW